LAGIFLELRIMNISKEHLDDLNAVVKVQLGPDDYNSKVDAALKNYQKRVNMPGFRPGKVPAGLVKKMYGKSVLAEELNRILSDSLYNYIRDNNIEVLGNPLPKEDVNNQVDFESQTEFEFQFEVALAPQFNLALSSDMNYTAYKIQIDEKLIDGYVNDVSRRYGNISNTDTVGAGDLMYGDFVELNDAGEIVAGGIFHSSTMFLDNPVRAHHEAMLGLKADDKVVLTPEQIADNPADLASKLGIDQLRAQDLKGNFQFTIKSISRLHPAELNQELFDKIYGPGVVNSPEELRARIASELQGMFARDTDSRLRDDIASDLILRTNLNLPDAFLKRWLVQANEKPITLEQVEGEYDVYARQLRWQLIENKLIKDNNLEVTAEEATNHVKQILLENFAKYGRNPDEVSDDELNDTARRILSKEDEAKKVFTNLYQEKLMTLYRTKCSIQEKEVSYSEFSAS
jgi:trigger factor